MSEGGSSLGVLVIIGVVLVLIIGVANVAHAADRTVLDEETVIQTMDDEGVFASLSQELQDEISEDAQQALQNEDIEPIVFEQYVQDLDTTVIVQIDGLNDAYADIIRNQLDIEALAQEAFSEEYIRGEATRNVQQIFAYLQGDTDSLDIVVDLTEPRDHFVTAINDLRADIEQNPELIRNSIDDQTLDRLIEDEIDRLINEELEEDIQRAAAEPGSPSEEEIEQQVREDLRLQIDERIDDELQSPEVVDAFDAALADAEDEIRNEFGEEEELTEDETEPEELDDARDALGWFGLMLWGLPLAALGLVGGTYAYSRSLHRTGATLGASLAGAGVLGLVIGYTLPGVVEGAAESAVDGASELEATVLDAVIALINTLFSTVVTQSLVLTVAGVGLVGVVYADTNGYFDSIKGDGGDQPQAGYGQQGTYEQQYGEEYQQGSQAGQYQQGTQYQQEHGGQYQGGQTGEYQEKQTGTSHEGQYQQTGHHQQGTQESVAEEPVAEHEVDQSPEQEAETEDSESTELDGDQKADEGDEQQTEK